MPAHQGTAMGRLTTHILDTAEGKPAVELSFRFELPYGPSDDQPYLLCGPLDRVAADPDGEVAGIYKSVARQVAVKIAAKAKDYSSKFPSIKISKET